MRRCFYALVLLALCWFGESYSAPISGAAAARSHSITVETVSRGLRLTLIVPGSVYPRNALIRVTLLLQNVSSRDMVLDEDCGQGPYAEDTSRSGNEILNSKLPGVPLMPGSCLSSASPRIAPGHILAFNDYVVLRGPGIRAFDPAGRIETRPAVVTLVPGTAPRVIVTPGKWVHATVKRPAGALSSLLISQWSSCLEHGMPLSQVNLSWTPVAGQVVAPWFSSPECQQILEWHAYVGYVGWPVGRIDYKAPPA